MTEDTIRAVEDIRCQGWYPQGTTLGVGGWPEVSKFASGWKKYVVLGPGDDGFPYVIARDDAAARAYFTSKFFLEDEQAIAQVTTHYRYI